MGRSIVAGAFSLERKELLSYFIHNCACSVIPVRPGALKLQNAGHRQVET